MKINPIYLAIFLFWLVFPQLLIAETLTLDECIALAKENNLQLREAKMDIERAWAGVTEANAAYYPSLGLSSGYRYGGNLQESKTGSYSTGIDARYTIYKGGSIRAGTKIAQTRVKIAQANYQQKENEVVFSVKQAFFKILQIQEQISLIKNILKRRQDNLTLLKLNYSVGRENEPNVKQAEASLKQTEYEYRRAEKNLALAKMELARLLNHPWEAIAIEYEEENKELPSLDSLTKAAKNERPEMARQKANQEVILGQIKQAKSNYLPAISLSSSYGLQGDKFLEQKSNWSAGIGLSIPLFDGFATKAKVREATLALKQNELNLEDLMNSIEQEVRMAYADYELATKNLEVTNKILEAARAAYQLTKLQYEQGRTSYFFLQQKENELTQAENSYVNALYNLRVLLAQLEKTVGRSN